jgi:Zn-dependent membrane protease YugP
MDFWLMWYDNGLTILLMIIGFILVLFAQIRINSAYSKYRRIQNYKGLTGYEVAKTILNANGLSNIEVYKTSGNLTDHYDPSKKLIRLSSAIYNGTSIASMAVAAHECGHAIQDKENYIFFKIRSFLVPIVNFISYLGYFGLIVSLIGGLTGYIKLSILILFATVVFQLVTLPVEFDASRRGKNQLSMLNLSFEQDNSGIKSVLSAAAMTYVAGLLSSILQLLRLVLILGSRDRD